jgi:protein O-mannosyl-transferase
MRSIGIGSLVILVVALAVFFPALDGQFLNWDDDVYIVNNARAQDLTPANVSWFFTNPYFASYTPLAIISHGIDWALWGPSPRAHHRVSLLFHGANSILVFLVGVLLLGRNRGRKGPLRADGPPIPPDVAGAFAAALVFAVHPLRVESVAWVSDRKDLLAAFFSLVSVLAYLVGAKSEESRTKRLWTTLSVLAYGCALMSKVLAIPLPAVLLLIDATVLHPNDWKKQLRPLLLGKVPYLIPAFGIGILATLAVGSSAAQLTLENVTWLQRIIFPFYSPWFYLAKFFVPSTLSPAYHIRITPILLLAALPVLMITGTTIAAARRGRSEALGAWLSFLMLLSPTYLLLSPWIQAVADRHTYLSMVPLLLLGGAGFQHLWMKSYETGRGGIVRAAGASVLLLLGIWYSFLSGRQIRVWQNSISLWTQAITVSPEHTMAYSNLGAAIAATGNFADAAQFYRYAIRLEPHYAPAWYNLGIVHLSRGNADSAEMCFRTAISSDPLYQQTYWSLGALLESGERWPEAIETYRVLRMKTAGDANVWNALGKSFFSAKEIDSARTCFSRAVALRPSFGEAHWGLGNALMSEGKSVEAEREFKTAELLGYRGREKRGESKAGAPGPK